MRVLIFSTAYFPFIGGAEVAVKEVTDRINDIEFDIITARMDKNLLNSEKIGNVNIYRVGFGCKLLDKFLLPFLGYLKAKKLYKQASYSIIWSIMASQASIAACFFKIKFPQVKLLLTLQEGDEEEHLRRYVLGIDWLYKLLIRPWYLLVFKRAGAVTVISNYLRDRAIRNGVKCEVKVVPNGVDISKFSISDFRFPILKCIRWSPIKTSAASVAPADISRSADSCGLTIRAPFPGNAGRTKNPL